MKRRYSEKQLNMLRSALMEYRQLGTSDGGQPYSWNSISEAIQEKTGADIPFKNLSKFAQGIPARGASENEREYPRELANNGLEHLIDFLTEESDGFAILSKSEFENQERETRWPEHLQSYLGNDQNDLTIDLKAMSGTYYTRNIKQDYVLTVMSDPKKKQMKFSVSSKVKDEDYEEYDGWFVSSMQDQILLIGKDAHDPDNYLVYLLVGTDNKIRRREKPVMFCLMDYKFPEDRYDLPNEYNFFMSSINEEIKNSLHVYCAYPKPNEVDSF